MCQLDWCAVSSPLSALPERPYLPRVFFLASQLPGLRTLIPSGARLVHRGVGTQLLSAFPVVMIIWVGLARFVVPDWPIPLTLLPTLLVFAVLSPLISMSAKVLWIHLDRTWKAEARS